MQQIKKKCSKMFAFALAFVLMFNMVGPIQVKATGNTAINSLRQEDFENLNATDTVVDAIGWKQNGDFSLGDEGNNKYATYTYADVGNSTNLFYITKSAEKTVEENKAIWITMDLRSTTTNSGIIKFRARKSGATSTTFDLFMLASNSIRVGSTKYTQYDFSKWKTVVCKLHENKCTIYIANNGELTQVCDPVTWTWSVTDFGDIQVRTASSSNTGTWEIDNVAIYQNDTYVDLFPEADELVYEASVTSGTADPVNYEKLQDAINAANSNSTTEAVEIDLLASVISNANIIINSGVTLDLNGNTLDMDDSYLYSLGDVVDDSLNKAGRLVVGTYAENEEEGITAGTPKGMLDKANDQVPVYIAGEGYMFASMLGQKSVSITEDSFTVISRPSFGDGYAEKLANGADAAKLQFIIRLNWSEDETDYYQNLKYVDGLVKTVYEEGKAFSATVNGLSEYKDNMKVTVLVKSDLGVEWENNSFYMSTLNE